MRILLASPRGFCAGVDRAIEIVELALKQESRPVYVRHEIVHNRHVVDGLRDKGATFIEDPNDVPFNFFYTSNISLPREVFAAYGGFREDYGTGLPDISM